MWLGVSWCGGVGSATIDIRRDLGVVKACNGSCNGQCIVEKMWVHPSCSGKRLMLTSQIINIQFHQERNPYYSGHAHARKRMMYQPYILQTLEEFKKHLQSTSQEQSD